MMRERERERERDQIRDLRCEIRRGDEDEDRSGTDYREREIEEDYGMDSEGVWALGS